MEGGRERDRWREGEREGGERKIEREREITLLFKILRDDNLKLSCFYYFSKYF